MPAHDPELLAREIADRLPSQTPVRFMASPFSTDIDVLKRLQIHFEREKLIDRHDFSCLILAEDATPESLCLFSQLNFSELIVEFPQVDFDANHWLLIFKHCREYRIKLHIIMGAPLKELDEITLGKTYLFLQENIGSFTLDYTTGYFASEAINESFLALARQSQDVNKGQRSDAFLNENFYRATYEFMRLKFGSRVKTVLEINPFADYVYYEDYNRVPFPWEVTLSPVKGAQLDIEQLNSLNKTFDAIVIFQGLPRLRDPKQAILQLQRYARPTTQWICVQFNLCAFPNLALLLENKLYTGLANASYWPYLRFQGKESLTRLFEGTGIQFEWVPTEVQIPEIKQMTQVLDPLFQAELPAKWQGFKTQSHVMLWTAHGEIGLEELEETQEGFAEGFL